MQEHAPVRPSPPTALSSFSLSKVKENSSNTSPQLSPFAQSPGQAEPHHDQNTHDRTVDNPIVHINSPLPDKGRPSPDVSDWNEKAAWETRQISQASVSRDPPRKAREGFEWVWFPEGYWAERRQLETLPQKKKVHRPRWFNRAPRDAASIHSTTSSYLTPSNRLRNSTSFDSRPEESSVSYGQYIDVESASTQGSKAAETFKYISPTYPHFRSPSGTPEGLYCKVKRGVGVTSTPKQAMYENSYSVASSPFLQSKTTILLKGTAEHLQESEDARQRRQDSQLLAADPPSPLVSTSTTGSRSRRRFGLAPWHRRTSNDSVMSATSSVRKIIRGKTPAATPLHPGMDHRSSEQLSCSFRVDITQPSEPNFLASEARRILTPQCSIDSPGYFIDDKTSYGAASSDNTWSSPSFLSTSMQNTDIGSNAGNINESSNFVLALPDHLPNSPICPKNPKHPSGGTEFCSSHGQGKEAQDGHPRILIGEGLVAENDLRLEHKDDEDKRAMSDWSEIDPMA